MFTIYYNKTWCAETRRRNNTHYANIVVSTYTDSFGRCNIHTKSIYRAISAIAFDEQCIKISVEIYNCGHWCQGDLTSISMYHSVHDIDFKCNFHSSNKSSEQSTVALTTLEFSSVYFPYTYTESVEKTKKLNLKNNIHTHTSFTIIKKVSYIFRLFHFYWKHFS